MPRIMRRRLQDDDNSVTLPVGAKITEVVSDHGVRWLHAEVGKKVEGFATKRVHLAAWSPQKSRQPTPPHGFSFMVDESNGRPLVLPVRKITGAGTVVVPHTIAVAGVHG